LAQGPQHYLVQPLQHPTTKFSDCTTKPNATLHNSKNNSKIKNKKQQSNPTNKPIISSERIQKARIHKQKYSDYSIYPVAAPNHKLINARHGNEPKTKTVNS